jgi:hypothetical protein
MISMPMVHLAQTVHLSSTRLTLYPNGPKQASTWHTLHRRTIGCAQSDFHAHSTFVINRAPILHQDQNYLQMDQNELPLDPRHLGVPSGVSKMISKPMVHASQTMHLSCIEINTISRQTKMSFHLTHITLEYHRVHPKWFPSLWYFRRKPCTYLAPRLTLSPNGLNKLPLSIYYLGVPSSLPKVISMPGVHSSYTVHLSCTEISTISKWIEMSFHLIHVA